MVNVNNLTALVVIAVSALQWRAINEITLFVNETDPFGWLPWWPPVDSLNYCCDSQDDAANKTKELTKQKIENTKRRRNPLPLRKMSAMQKDAIPTALRLLMRLRLCRLKSLQAFTDFTQGICFECVDHIAIVLFVWKRVFFSRKLLFVFSSFQFHKIKFNEALLHLCRSIRSWRLNCCQCLSRSKQWINSNGLSAIKQFDKINGGLMHIEKPPKFPMRMNALISGPEHSRNCDEWLVHCKFIFFPHFSTIIIFWRIQLNVSRSRCCDGVDLANYSKPWMSDLPTGAHEFHQLNGRELGNSECAFVARKSRRHTLNA